MTSAQIISTIFHHYLILWKREYPHGITKVPLVNANFEGIRKTEGGC
jgi:hypothetical protein